MNLDDYRKKQRQTPEYIAAEKELKPLLNFADQVLNLRLARGWSQAELAERAGAMPRMVTNIESGLPVPQIDAMQRIANVLGADLRIEMVEQQYTWIADGVCQSLVKVQVEKETRRTYTPVWETYENIIGENNQLYPRRLKISKLLFHCFDTLGGALAYLDLERQKLDEHIARLEGPPELYREYQRARISIEQARDS